MDILCDAVIEGVESSHPTLLIYVDIGQERVAVKNDP